MSRLKDRYLILEAADKWLDDLAEQAAHLSKEDRKESKKHQKRLHKAVLRESARLTRKRILKEAKQKEKGL